MACTYYLTGIYWDPDLLNRDLDLGFSQFGSLGFLASNGNVVFILVLINSKQVHGIRWHQKKMYYDQMAVGSLVSFKYREELWHIDQHLHGKRTCFAVFLSIMGTMTGFGLTVWEAYGSGHNYQSI